MAAKHPIVHWFRNDLRLQDHPGLDWIACQGRQAIGIYVWNPEDEQPWAPGAASRWWLHHSLLSLRQSLEQRGSTLVVRQGDTTATLISMARATGADTVSWCERIEPAAKVQEAGVRRALVDQGLTVQSSNATQIWRPDESLSPSGKPYQVFTPYWRSCMAKGVPKPKPCRIPTFVSRRDLPASSEIENLRLLPKVNWDSGLKANWIPGEMGAQRALAVASSQVVEQYTESRDFPGIPGTSRLSPHLHFGEVCPLRAVNSISMGSDDGALLRQLVWREFANHLLYHFPQTESSPLRPEFESFPWSEDEEGLRRWQQGQTGYPLVDAGMRELWHTGWMHNRARMIAASFLVKHLLIHWQQGAKWFWDTLVDADLPNNSLGWQWVAGSGADSAPYFRIFNPISQSERFDPDGVYIRKWVPELAQMPSRWIHRPWEAPAPVIRQSGVLLGETYPHRLVDHEFARRRALECYAHMRGKIRPQHDKSPRSTPQLNLAIE